MFTIKLSENLKRHTDDVRFRAVARAALNILELTNIDRETLPSGKGQTAESVANLQIFRRDSGYYKNATILGLDESIGSLQSFEGLVKLCIIETRLGTIAGWVDDQWSLVSLMVFYTKITPYELPR